jgi:hypothetical protein
VGGGGGVRGGQIGGAQGSGECRGVVGDGGRGRGTGMLNSYLGGVHV